MMEEDAVEGIRTKEPNQSQPKPNQILTKS